MDPESIFVEVGSPQILTCQFDVLQDAEVLVLKWIFRASDKGRVTTVKPVMSWETT